MNTKEFQQLIRETPTLSEDRKEYYLAKSEDYSAETIERIVQIIHEEEKKLAKFVKEKKQEIEKEKMNEAHERLLAAEKAKEGTREKDEVAANEIIEKINT